MDAATLAPFTAEMAREASAAYGDGTIAIVNDVMQKIISTCRLSKDRSTVYTIPADADERVQPYVIEWLTKHQYTTVVSGLEVHIAW